MHSSLMQEGHSLTINSRGATEWVGADKLWDRSSQDFGEPEGGQVCCDR